MLSHHLFLVGMPGSGKTYWGKLLSKYYNVPWIDLDRQVEATAGRSIVSIFETEGEAAFRLYEQTELHASIKEATGPVIVACGGGTPLFFDQMAWMKNHGIVIFLQASFETLMARLQKNFQHRPLLKNDLSTSTQLLLKEREELYQQADITISALTPDLNIFIEKIASCTKQA